MPGRLVRDVQFWGVVSSTLVQTRPDANHFLWKGTMLRNRKGFTLIELLIVVVIIGILAAIAIPKFASTKDQAKRKSLQSDVRNVMTAQEAYFGTYNAYAASLTALGFIASAGNDVTTEPVGTAGFSVNATNSTISADPKTCTVTVGDGSATDGVINCGTVAP